MDSRVKMFGHAIHPILIVFPLGLLTGGVIFDVIYLFSANPTFATVAYWMITAGLIGGILAAPFGLIDWLKIPSGTRANSIGLMHGLTMACTLLLFFGSWLFRYETPIRPGAIASVFSFAGGALAVVGGWLGGELVERLGVGIDEGANLNAPSSLSSSTVRPAEINMKKV
jgi:uncharacterized membrane protein